MLRLSYILHRNGALTFGIYIDYNHHKFYLHNNVECVLMVGLGSLTRPESGAGWGCTPVITTHTRQIPVMPHIVPPALTTPALPSSPCVFVLGEPLNIACGRPQTLISLSVGQVRLLKTSHQPHTHSTNNNKHTTTAKLSFLLLCYSWQNEEHPEVNPEHQDDLEDDFAHDSLPEVEGAVHYHGRKLDQHHDQEGPWHLVLRQRRGDVCRRMFLEQRGHSCEFLQAQPPVHHQ